MISSELMQYVSRNLMNRKLRSGLTILSIFVGIATLFIFISFGWGLYSYVGEISEEMGVDKIIITPKGIGTVDDTFELDSSDLNTVKKTRGIKSTAGMLYKSSKLDTGDELVYAFIMSLPVEDKDDFKLIMEFMTVDVIDGRNIKNGDKNKIVLGYSYSVDNKIVDKAIRVGDKVKINDIKMSVIGFMDELGNPQDDSNIYTTKETMHNLFNEDDKYSVIISVVDNVDDIDNTVERVEKNIRKNREEEEGKETFEVESFAELLETFSNVLDMIIGFIILIALVSVFTSAVNTANTMFTSILERTKEIGILKAIGAKNSFIWMVFLLEASLLGFVAGTLGALFGYLLSNFGGNILAATGYSFLQPKFSISLFLYCILFATLVGAISGMIPAYNASKKNPVDSLRYE